MMSSLSAANLHRAGEVHLPGSCNACRAAHLSMAAAAKCQLPSSLNARQAIINHHWVPATMLEKLEHIQATCSMLVCYYQVQKQLLPAGHSCECTQKPWVVLKASLQCSAQQTVILGRPQSCAKGFICLPGC